MGEELNPIDYLRAIVAGLVQNEDAVQISESDDDRGKLLTLQVHKSDMSVVIGKEGATIRAIKRLLWAYGTNQESKISIKVLEPGQ